MCVVTRKWKENKSTYLSRRSRLSTVPAKSNTHERYTVLVVKIAQIVPMGILFWASAKSPERFDPAIIPEMIFMRWRHAHNDDWVKWLTGYRWEKDANQNCKCCREICHYLIICVAARIFIVFRITSIRDVLPILYKRRKERNEENNEDIYHFQIN